MLTRFVEFFSAGLNPLASVRVVTAPHHGSANNLSGVSFLRLGAPPIAVVPAGKKTHHGHPSDAVIEMLTLHGARIEHAHDGPGSWAGVSE